MYSSAHSVLQQIDFPFFWAEKLKIKTIIPLSEELTNKIRIIHRLNFYRESILDLMRENNLEQMLVMVTPPLCRLTSSSARTSSCISRRTTS